LRSLRLPSALTARAGVEPIVERRDPGVDAFASPVGGTNESDDGLEYVFIPAGTFEMGCVSERDDCLDDKPRYHVELTRGFWLGRTLVTAEACQRFLNDTGRPTPQGVEYTRPSEKGRPAQSLVGTMPLHSAGGRVAVCPPKRSGNTPLAAEKRDSRIPGVRTIRGT
jgi:formylglycine-generating enzyme required for sulfatase activity